MPNEPADVARDEASNGPRKQKTYYLTDAITSEVNGAVYWSRALALSKADPAHLDDLDMDEIPDSASALVERALWAEVLRLRDLYNEGRPFPPAPSRLATGPGQSGKERMSGRRES